MTDETKQTILDGLFRLGAPCVILCFVLWMIREGASNIHTTVVVPMVKHHTEFLDATQKTLDGIEKSQERQAATMDRIAEGQREIQRTLGARIVPNPGGG